MCERCDSDRDDSYLITQHEKVKSSTHTRHTNFWISISIVYFFYMLFVPRTIVVSYCCCQSDVCRFESVKVNGFSFWRRNNSLTLEMANDPRPVEMCVSVGIIAINDLSVSSSVHLHLHSKSTHFGATTASGEIREINQRTNARLSSYRSTVQCGCGDL